MTDTDWKARAEAAEARATWLEEQISHYKEDLRVQKASHEMRVKELEARPKVFCAMLTTGVCNLPERVKELESRLTVTDEMVRDLLDFVGAVAGENRPSREWAVRLRAALTAALEARDDQTDR